MRRDLTFENIIGSARSEGKLFEIEADFLQYQGFGSYFLKTP